MQGQGTSRRRIRYAYKDFQKRYIVNYLIGAVTIIVAVAFSLALLTIFYNTYGLSDMFYYLAGLNVIIIFALLTMVYWAALIYSNRTGGPLLRLEKALDSVSQGDLNCEIFLREKDQLKNLACCFNAMTESLKTRMGHINEQLEGLEVMANGSASDQKVLEMISKIREDFKSSFNL